MKKEVILSLKGIHFGSTDDDNEIETLVCGRYYKKNKNHFVKYEETLGDIKGGIKSLLKWNDQILSLTREGLINAHMTFEKNKKSVTDYRTPFGGIIIGIDTKDIVIKEKEDSICLDVYYGLDLNYEYLADCHISIGIRPRES